MKQFVLDHLVHECNEADRVVGCSLHNKDADLTIKLKDGKTVGVFVINRAIRLPEIKERYEANTARGIHTLFILDHRMLPPENSKVSPPHWMEALHTLTSSRIYTYQCDGRAVTIRPLHMEWRWGDAPRFVEYGAVVKLNDLRAEMVEPNSKFIAGKFAAASFGEGSFWKKKTPLDEAQYRYSWRHWSYSEPKSRVDQEPDDDWNSWEEFSRQYGEVGGDHEPQWDWAGAQEQTNTHQRRSRKAAQATVAGREHYAVLGVPLNASFEDVKRAYRQKAREYHPDLHPDEIEKYTAKMAEINTAFEAISKQKNK
ncbi:MAG: J domain-containing protein [Anaerolinea sp.]|nr:J domain-containing protein [Anaerolinea sp.]